MKIGHRDTIGSIDIPLCSVLYIFGLSRVNLGKEAWSWVYRMELVARLGVVEGVWNVMTHPDRARRALKARESEFE